MKKSVIIALSLALCSQLAAQSDIQPTELFAEGAEPFWGLSMTATNDDSYQAVFTQAAEPPNDKITSHLVLENRSPVSGAVLYHGVTENNRLFSVITAKITCLEDRTEEASPLSIFVIWNNQRIYQGCGRSNLDEAAEESGEESGEGNGMAEYFDFLMHTLSHSKNPKSAQRLLASQDKWSDYVAAHCTIFAGFTNPTIMQAKEQCESILSKQRVEVIEKLGAVFDNEK